MFSYTGLGKAQCKHLREKMHIYLLMDGRISMAGINTGNYKYLAQVRFLCEFCVSELAACSASIMWFGTSRINSSIPSTA